MSSDPKPVGGQWHKAARGELSPPKGASEETLVPQLFTASVPDPRTVQPGPQLTYSDYPGPALTFDLP